MDIQHLHKLFLQSSAVSTDTRNIPADSMFFALKGSNFNGNKFAGEALKQGAKFAIIDEEQQPMQEGMILVEDVLQTLQLLAKYHRNSIQTNIIGITGTNGKTTTKELIHAVLSSHYLARSTVGNLNNHIGVPLTLLALTGQEKFAVIEMGANHPDEIADLCKICDPDFGIITNVGRAHLEGFGSFENIVRTKKGLYQHIAKKNGTIFINSGDPVLRENDVQKQIFYGTRVTDFCRGKLTSADPFVEVDCYFRDGEQHIKTHLIGDYNFENILAACCIGSYFEIPGEKIKQALENYVPGNNRSEYRETAKNKLILDAYNANPSSMEKALENFAAMKQSSKLAILGDMFELGNYAPEQHAAITRKALSLDLPSIFVGEEFYKTKTAGALFFKTVEDLADYLKENPQSGQLILIKGSRGIKLERLVEYL